MALDLAAMLLPYFDDVAEACAKAKKPGRGGNKLKPDPLAQCPHSTFRRNKDGNVNHYEEFSPNPRNPRGFDTKKRYEGEDLSHGGVDTPHVHEGRKVRPSIPAEIPGKFSN